MLDTGAEVLPDRHYGYTYRAQVGQDPEHLLLGLAQAQHEPRLGREPGIARPGQHSQASRVGRRWPYRPLQAGHGLDVVVEDVGSLLEDLAQRGRVPLAVRDQDLDRRAGTAPADGLDCRREAGRPPVLEVIPGDTGNHGVSQTETGDSLGHLFRLGGVQGQRFGRIDLTETASTRATVAVDHERRRTVRPALEDVGATGLLADGHQAEAAHRLAQRAELGTHVGVGSQPRRLASFKRKGTGRVDAGLGQLAEAAE